MFEEPLEEIKRLEQLAAWHRINADRAGADWVWEARLRAAEDLERRAAKLRGQFSSGEKAEAGNVSSQAREHGASDDNWRLR